MFERRSLKAPIWLGVVMICLVVVLAAIWVVGYVGGATGLLSRAEFFWAFLVIGSVLLAGMLAGVIAYLTLTVKAFRLNQRQSNFIDSVTHELKSPIASLKLYLQTMARRNVDQSQTADFHRFMLEDVERLDSLINHLLDTARIDRGTEESHRETFRLDRLLGQCGSSACLRYRLPEETVILEVPPLQLNGPLVQIEILFRNLIDNAVKYGGNPPRVTIRGAAVEADSVLISISDNGLGVPADQRRNIFGRFVRLGSELERSRPGTGLGLHLVRTVVRALGGSVTVGEGDDGLGTRFDVTLPGLQPNLDSGPIETDVVASREDLEKQSS